MRVILAVLVFLAVAARAEAQSCGAIVDEAGMFGDAAPIAAVARELTAADVRVYTVKTYAGHANLDQFQAARERQCGWVGADGTRKPNLLAVAISAAERQMGIYYGPLLTDALAGRTLGIQDTLMKPRLRARDASGAVVAALREVHRLVALQLAPPSPPSAPPAAQVSPSTSAFGFGLFLVCLAGLGAMAGAVALWVRHANRRVELETEKRRLRALVAGVSADITRLRAAVAQAETDASVRDKAAVRRARDGYARAAMAFDARQQPGQPDPMDDALPLAAYRDLSAAYRSLADALAEVERDLRRATTGEPIVPFREPTKPPPPAPQVQRPRVSTSRRTVESLDYSTSGGGHVIVAGNTVGGSSSSRDDRSRDSGGSASGWGSSDSGGSSSFYDGGSSGGDSGGGSSSGW